MVAVGIIVLLTTVNYYGVRFGGMIQNIFTSMKIAAIVGIVIIGFSAGTGSVSHFLPLWGIPTSGPLLPAIGIAMIVTLWSYDGWANLTFIGGSANPQRNIPLALSLGTITVIMIYVLTNLAYLYVLPINEIASSRLVAADVMEKIYPGYGGAVISIAVMISTFGSVNGSCMTTARVFLRWRRTACSSRDWRMSTPEYHTPAKSLVVQCVWASLLTLSGTFDQLFTYVMFAGWIFTPWVRPSVHSSPEVPAH